MTNDVVKDVVKEPIDVVKEKTNVVKMVFEKSWTMNTNVSSKEYKR